MNLTGDTLRQAGYKSHPVGIRPEAKEFWQKRIRDNSGATLYFINIWLYDTNIGDHHYVGVHPEVQFRTGDKAIFNVTLLVGTTTSLTDIENFFASVYQRLECTPYERR